jgi:hypothetical protein
MSRPFGRDILAPFTVTRLCGPPLQRGVAHLVGEDLANQVDPDFVPGPAVTVR